MKKLFLTLILIFSFTSLVACSSNDGDVLSKVQEKGVLTLGTSADYAPYEFHILNEDMEDEIVGFEIEIAKKIAESLDVELKIVDMSFDGLLTALNSNQVDMVIAGMTPTAEREEAVSFSEVFYTSEQVVLVRAEEVDNYNSIEDFDRKKIGFQRGSLQETIFNENFTESTAVSLTKIPNIILELKNGTIDGAIIEYAVAKGYLEQYPELTIANVEIDAQDGGSAVAVKKDETQLLDAINEVLAKLKEEDLIDQFVSDAILIAEY